MNLDVICPNCGECYFETNDKDLVLKTPEQASRDILFRNFKKKNDVLFKKFSDEPVKEEPLSDYVRKYDPEAPASAAMIRLKKEFVGTHIEDIQHDRDLKGFAVEPCPGCNQSLSDDSFRFITRPQAEDANRLTCKFCDRPPFKTIQGRVSHETRFCKGNPDRIVQ